VLYGRQLICHLALQGSHLDLGLSVFIRPLSESLLVLASLEPQLVDDLFLVLDFTAEIISVPLGLLGQGGIALQQPGEHDFFLLRSRGQCGRFLLQVVLSCLLDILLLLRQMVDGLLLLLHLLAQCLFLGFKGFRVFVCSLRGQGGVALQQPFYHGLFLLHGLGHSSIFLLHVCFSCLLGILFLRNQMIQGLLLLFHLCAQRLRLGNNLGLNFLPDMHVCNLHRQSCIALQQPCEHGLFLLQCLC